jgi:hypothetical protein
MWTPQTVTERIASGSLLPDSMFASLDADALLDKRDDSSDDDWVRAAESLQYEWDRYPDASRATPWIDAVREAAFKRPSRLQVVTTTSQPQFQTTLISSADEHCLESSYRP